MDPIFNEALIKEVKKYEFIYNKYDPRYLPTVENLKHGYRTKAWDSIANKMNKSADECKSRWKNLRDQYLRIAKAYDGNPVLEKYETWFHYKSLGFLKGFYLAHPQIYSEKERRSSNTKRKGSNTPEMSPIDPISDDTVLLIDDEDDTEIITQENKRRKIDNDDTSLSIKTKLYIIRLLVEGEDSVDIAKKFDVPLKTITSIYENAADLRNNIEAKKLMELEDRKMEKMEILLTTWVSNMNKKKSRLSSEIIKNKAISIYNDLEQNPNDIDDHVKFFQARDKWFEEWFKKNPEIHDTELLDDITDIYLMPENETRLSTDHINEFILNEQEILIPVDETLEVDPLTDIVDNQSELSNNQNKNKEEQNTKKANKVNSEKQEIIVIDDQNSENDDSIKSKKKTRVDLDIQLKIIELIDKGSKVSDVAKIFDLPQCVVQKILNKNAQNLRNLAAKTIKQLEDDSTFDDLVKKMEGDLIAWILETCKTTYISVTTIQRKAKSIYGELHKNFQFSKQLKRSISFNLEWFCDFQRRYGLKLNKDKTAWFCVSSLNRESISPNKGSSPNKTSPNKDPLSLNQKSSEKEIISLIEDEDVIDITDNTENIIISTDDPMIVNKENKRKEKENENEKNLEHKLNSKNKSKTMNKENINKNYINTIKNGLMLRLEEILSDWITDMFGQGLVIGSNHIRCKAQTIFKELKQQSNVAEIKTLEFPQNSSWFKNFQKRCDIRFDDEKNTWFQQNKYKPNIDNIPFIEDEISIINQPVDDILTDSMHYESQMSNNVNGKEEEINAQNSSSQNNIIDDQSQIITLINNIIDDQSQIIVDKAKIKEENVGTDEINVVNGENHISFGEGEHEKPNSEQRMNLKKEENKSPQKGNRFNEMSASTKFEIIQLVEKGLKPLEIAKKYNVVISTVDGLYQIADKIICDYISTEANEILDNDRKLRLELIQRTEESLTIWIIDMNRKQKKIYKEDVQKEALRIFSELKENSINPHDPNLIFYPINFWFSNYKTRFSISETNENDIIFDPLIDTDNNNMDYQFEMFVNEDEVEDANANNTEEEFFAENQPFIISEDNFNSKSEDFPVKDYIQKDEIDYTIPYNIKLEIIELFGIGKPLSYIAKKFNLSKYMVLEIYQNFEQVYNYPEGTEKVMKVQTDSSQSDLIFKMEAALTDWVHRMTVTKSSLSESAVKCKAKRLFDEMKKTWKKPREVFVANKAWFKAYLERSNLSKTGLVFLSTPPLISSPDTEIKNQTTLVQQMEKILITWILDMKKQNSPVNKHTIKNKAKSILFHLQQNSNGTADNLKLKFIASEIWYKNFVKRTGINTCIAEDIPPPSKMIIKQHQNDLIQQMETLLAAWIFDMNSNNLPMSFKNIQNKAVSLYNDLRANLDNSKNYIENTFKASSKWFKGFKNRFCLQNLKFSEDKSNMENKIDSSSNVLNGQEKPLSNKELISLFQDEPSSDTVSVCSNNNYTESDQNEMNMEVDKSVCEDKEEEEEIEDEEEEEKHNVVHDMNDDNPTTIKSPEITNTSNNSEENYYYYLKKKTRKYNISLRSKVQILELLDKGLKRPLICKQLGLPMSTVCYVSHNANKIREKIRESGTVNTTEVKPVVARSFLIRKVEKLLVAWILDINEKHLKLDSRSIKAKALTLFSDLKKHFNYTTQESFTASYGWFTSFRQRSGIEITLSRKNVDAKEYSSNVSPNTKPLSNDELILLYLEDKNYNDEIREDQNGVITIEDDDDEGEIEEIELEEEDELELEEQLALDEENEYEFEYKKFIEEEEEEDLKIKEENLKLKEKDLELKEQCSKMDLKQQEEEQENENEKAESKDYTTNAKNSEPTPIQLEPTGVNFEEDFVRFLKVNSINDKTFIPQKLKFKIIQLLNIGETVANIALQLKTEESIILQLKEEIDNTPTDNTENQSELTQKMEKLLLAWISDVKSKNLQLTPRMVQEKAKSLFNYLKEKSKNTEDSKQVFNGGYNWLEGFKKRCSVTINYGTNEVDTKKQQTTNSTSPTIKLNNIEKRPRSAISFKQKLDIIQLLDKGNKAAHIARELGIPETTVRTIYKNADKIRNNIAAGSVLSCEATTKIRSSLMQRMEKLLTSWIVDVNNKNLPISSRIIQEKARSLFNDLKESSRVPEDAQQTFNASYGWFERFKKRSGIATIKLLNEVENIDFDDNPCNGNLNLKEQPLTNEELILIYGEDVTSVTSDTINGSTEENHIISLDDDNEENEQQNLVVLDESSDEESESNDFPLEKLTEAMKDLDHAMEIFQKYDKNTNRSKSVRLIILEGIECYRNLLHVKDNEINKNSNNKNRISIDGASLQNHIEICNLPTE